MIVDLVEEAVANGARVEPACEVLCVSSRSVERWRKDPKAEDRREGPKTTPPHALTPEERERIIALSTSPKYRNMSIRQVVPRLADEGIYVASESSFYRVLHEERLMAHREHARPASKSKPHSHVATGPCEVWSWDITYLRAPVRGTFVGTRDCTSDAAPSRRAHGPRSPAAAGEATLRRSAATTPGTRSVGSAPPSTTWAGLEAVRTLAGHSTLAMTQRYAHATGNDLKEAIGKLGK